MVAGPGRAPHRRPAAADAQRSRSRHPRREHACPERRDRHGRDGRPYLDAALCAPQRLPAGHPFLQAFRRSDRPRGICRLRRRHGAHRLCPRRRADLPQRELFPRALRPALAPAGMALPRYALRHPCRASRRQVQLHAADLPSPARPAHPPDGHVPGGRTHDGALAADRRPARDGVVRHSLSSRDDRAHRMAALAAARAQAPRRAQPGLCGAFSRPRPHRAARLGWLSW